jgi:DNA-binding response OmpR family regulator
MRAVDQLRRILVVEADEVLAELVTLIITESGFVADRVSDVAGALDYLQGKPLPAALLLDLCVRGMSGISLVQECRRNDRLSHLAILVLTSQRCVKFADDLAPDAVIEKPFDIDALCASLDRITEAPQPSFVNATRHPLHAGRARVD